MLDVTRTMDSGDGYRGDDAHMTTQPVVTLRTLGPVALDGPDRPACARVLAQAKRLALLAYLSARPAGERVSRDVILATFWARAGRPTGRANLRNALYFLRDSLGTGIIVGNEAAVSVAPDGSRATLRTSSAPTCPGACRRCGRSLGDRPHPTTRTRPSLDLYRASSSRGFT